MQINKHISFLKQIIYESFDIFLFRCIVTHLGDPNTFLMDHLLLLKPVKFLEGELIHEVSDKKTTQSSIPCIKKISVDALFWLL